jgi:hypothetical protein
MKENLNTERNIFITNFFKGKIHQHVRWIIIYVFKDLCKQSENKKISLVALVNLVLVARNKMKVIAVKFIIAIIGPC